MKWLALLKQQSPASASATEPTKPGFVGFAACPSAPFQKNEPAGEAANDADATPAPDPDRYCWPHSPAMNAQEIDTFTARLTRFTDKGLNLTDSEGLADKLVMRDREGDDRRLCLECAHLRGVDRWSCGNWELAGMTRDSLARNLVLQFQRCRAFRGSAEVRKTNPTWQMISVNFSERES